MGSSTQTATLALPQFADNDKPTWRGDINGAFSAIDAAHTALQTQVSNDEANLDSNVAAKIGADVGSLTQTAGDGRWVRGAAFGVNQVVSPTHATVQAALNLGNGLRTVTAGAYTTTNTLTVSDECDLSMLTITYTGTGVAVQVGQLTNTQTSRKRFKLPKIVNGNKTVNGWAQVVGSVGVLLSNLYTCTIDIPYVSAFERGVVVGGAASNGSQHNTFNLGHLDNNKINLDANYTVTADTTGWSNQNTVVGGRMSHNSNEGSQVAGTRHLRLSALTQAVNGWTFLGTSFESPDVVEYHWELANTLYNTFVNSRFENSGAVGHRRVLCTGTTKMNTIIGGAYAESLVFVCTGGAVPPSRHLPGSMQITNTGGSPTTLVLENTASSTATSLIINPAGVAAAGTDPLVVNSWNMTANALLGKRTGDPVGQERVVIDNVNGKIKFGDGTIAPPVEWGALGTLHMINGATTQTTAPAAGAGAALPATPSGYLTMYINGTNRKIPYY